MPSAITCRLEIGAHHASCDSIPPGRVEPSEARWSCVSPLEIFAQSFLHRAQPKTRGPENVSTSSLSVIACVFNWPSARFFHVTYWKSFIPDNSSTIAVTLIRLYTKEPSTAFKHNKRRYYFLRTASSTESQLSLFILQTSVLAVCLEPSPCNCTKTNHMLKVP